MSFEKVEDHLRSLPTPEECGDFFEELCCWYLANDPDYRNRFNAFWRWCELRRGPDIGIDIVARSHNGDLWAIQAKAVGPKYSIKKSELDSFLSASSTSDYKHRMVIATTNNLSNNAKRTIANQRVKVDFILRRDLCSADVDWSVGLDPELRPKRPIEPLPAMGPIHQSMSLRQILKWADEHRGRTGKWPTMQSGQVQDVPNKTWRSIDTALRLGFRGLAGGSSLSRLLDTHRGVPNRLALPPLKVERILAWASKYQDLTGSWPTKESGTVREAQSETWKGINVALMRGFRGLPGGSSLAKLRDISECQEHP